MPGVELTDHQVQIDFIEALYQLHSTPHKNRAVFYEQYLSILKEQKDNSDFIALLNAKELDALQSGSISLIWIIFYELRPSFPYIAGKQVTKPEDFEKYLNIITEILPLLSKEILNTEFSLALGVPIAGNVHTALSLAVEFLIQLRKEDVTTKYQDHDIFQSMCQKWITQIIQYLMSQEVALDKGFIHGSSILAELIRYSPLRDNFYQLALQFLESTSQMDRREKPLVTAFALANLHYYPEEIQRKMLAKGADINLLSRPDLYTYSALEPVLNEAIRKKDYARIKQLLALGADPNIMPTADNLAVAFPKTRRNITLLTPYQLAVSLNDQETITLLRTHCRKNNIPINSELAPMEINRDLSDFLDYSTYKYQGPTLFMRVRDSFFGDRMLPDLKEKFGLSCFVESQSDVINVTKAIHWLYEKAPRSCAARFWAPVLEKLKQEQKDVNKFAIYVGETTSQFHTKHRNPEESTCLGIYYGNISVQSNLSVDEYVPIIAHEIGHLFDAKTFNLGSVMTITNDKVQTFIKAMKQDLVDFKKRSTEFDDFNLNLLIDELTLYSDETAKLKEFFTRVLVHIPISFAYSHPEATEIALMTKMHHYFPETMQWFEQLFPAINDTLEVASSRFTL